MTLGTTVPVRALATGHPPSPSLPSAGNAWDELNPSERGHRAPFRTDTPAGLHSTLKTPVVTGEAVTVAESKRPELVPIPTPYSPRELSVLLPARHAEN